jgi:hypothetical protein
MTQVRASQLVYVSQVCSRKSVSDKRGYVVVPKKSLKAPWKTKQWLKRYNLNV